MSDDKGMKRFRHICTAAGEMYHGRPREALKNLLLAWELGGSPRLAIQMETAQFGVSLEQSAERNGISINDQRDPIEDKFDEFKKWALKTHAQANLHIELQNKAIKTLEEKLKKMEEKMCPNCKQTPEDNCPNYSAIDEVKSFMNEVKEAADDVEGLFGTGY